MEETTIELCKAIIAGHVGKACAKQSILRIDLCTRLSSPIVAVDENLRELCWLASVDPRSRAAKRAARNRIGF